MSRRWDCCCFLSQALFPPAESKLLKKSWKYDRSRIDAVFNLPDRTIVSLSSLLYPLSLLSLFHLFHLFFFQYLLTLCSRPSLSWWSTCTNALSTSTIASILCCRASAMSWESITVIEPGKTISISTLSVLLRTIIMTITWWDGYIEREGDKIVVKRGRQTEK